MSYPGSPVKGQGPGEGEGMQATKSSKSEVWMKICSMLEWLAWSISLGNIGTEREQNLMSEPTKTENFRKEHPLGWNILERDCILQYAFLSPF